MAYLPPTRPARFIGVIRKALDYVIYEFDLFIIYLLSPFGVAPSVEVVPAARGRPGWLGSRGILSQKFLDSGTFFGFSGFIGDNIGRFLRRLQKTCGIVPCESKTQLPFWGTNKDSDNVMARATNRTTISLTDAEIEMIERLRDHFDAGSVSETIRRSLSQSSHLRRFSDEDGDLTVQHSGKNYVIAARG